MKKKRHYLHIPNVLCNNLNFRRQSNDLKTSFALNKFIAAAHEKAQNNAKSRATSKISNKIALHFIYARTFSTNSSCGPFSRHKLGTLALFNGATFGTLHRVPRNRRH